VTLTLEDLEAIEELEVLYLVTMDLEVATMEVPYLVTMDLEVATMEELEVTTMDLVEFQEEGLRL